MNRGVSTWAFLFLLATMSVGCVIVRSEGFTFGDADPIENSPLRLDGYYYRISDSSRITQGVSMYPLLLWKDGTAVYSNLALGKHLREEYGPGEPFEYGTLAQAKAVFERRIDDLLTGERSILFSWGAFRVQGDSILVQVMRSNGNAFQERYHAVQYSGKILSDTSFVLEKKVNFTGLYEGTYEIDMRYHFCPLNDGEKPTSDNWTQTHPELQ